MPSAEPSGWTLRAKFLIFWSFSSPEQCIKTKEVNKLLLSPILCKMIVLDILWSWSPLVTEKCWAGGWMLIATRMSRNWHSNHTFCSAISPTLSVTMTPKDLKPACFSGLHGALNIFFSHCPLSMDILCAMSHGTEFHISGRPTGNVSTVVSHSPSKSLLLSSL